MATPINLAQATPTIAAVKHPTRFGISLSMGRKAGTAISPVWTMAGWSLQFLRLAPGSTLEPDHSQGDVFVKVIHGALSSPPRKAYPEIGAVVSTHLSSESVTAGPESALLAIYTRTPSAPAQLSNVSQLTVAGPLAEALVWETFEDRYSRLTPYFNGLDAHLVPGFHLLDDDGAEIAYVFFWTAGKGVDLSTHNHGHTPSEASPAFAEVHQVLYNGTGAGGMYTTPEPGAAERERLPMQPGEEHGPFFVVDPATGMAKLRENGAVEYPWHGWQAGQDDEPGQRYDLVCAYEITAPYSEVA
ncbi:MAG: hypothetical protein JJT88_06165 [Gammaproteobacteria bacterium]|jgi:hypothetical protein|nr:hypothetical protein [Gammaproteobacteria bacterium]